MGKTYTLGSLFDGSGGFGLAGVLCGITPVWASEVEPYPIAVTTSRFPNMKHYGDVSKVNGAEVEPVDIITFGSPCQDMSIAGKRAGLKHESKGDDETTLSGLFMEAIRIIKEMRKATNGKYPRFAIWENVTGAFSSNKGEDFRVVLEELIRIKEPSAAMPPVPRGGWNYADCYRGDGWSLAYRTFDAQYWGVPQQRRRIYLVFDFAGQCAGDVLFKRTGLSGNFEQGSQTWQGSSGDTEEGVTYAVRILGTVKAEGKTPCLQARMGTGGNQVPLCFGIGNGQVNEAMSLTYEKAKTLNTMHDAEAILQCAAVGCRNRTVRRLTPTECARLQGFPDEWGHPIKKDSFSDEEYEFWHEVKNTHESIAGKIPKKYKKKQLLNWYNKLHTDSSEYKMWGNGIALPCALYCMEGIKESLMN